MNNNFNIEKINNDINNKIISFIDKAKELVELSEDDYQIEKTLKLNKISLKGYILDSPCCNSLKENNIIDYSIDELKKYIDVFEKTFNIDCTKYYLTLYLYEQLEEIETLVDNKITDEINLINKIIPNIINIKKISKENLPDFYMNVKNELEDSFKLNKINENVIDNSILIINDIFNFYINGYPNILEN